MLNFPLHNRPLCQAGTRSLIMFTTIIFVLIMFIITVTYRLTEMLGSPGPWGSCPNTNICCSSSSKHLYTLCPGASCRALSIFAFRAIRKTQPVVPVIDRATLFGRWELTTCNTFSVPPGMCPPPLRLPLEPTLRGSRPRGTTCYEVATGSLHPAEPQAPLAAGHPNDSANCIADPVHEARCLPVPP